MTSSTRVLAAGALIAGFTVSSCLAPPSPSRRRQPVYYQPAALPDHRSSKADPTTGPSLTGSSQCNSEPGQIFPAAAPWNQPVDELPTAPNSDAVIAYLASAHRTRFRFETEFSIPILQSQASTPREAFVPSKYHYLPDCDLNPVPVPEDGHLEGETGYRCEGDGDCHLIVLDADECTLYEMWKADLRPDQFNGGCLATWDVSTVYPREGRGADCSSADAAGLPIAPLLFSADEILTGEIRHAIRFILPNEHIKHRAYVFPATHATPAASGGKAAPPYGARFRLRSDADLTLLSPSAQVVARALQKYGMILADGGNITFTAQNDSSTTAKWDEVGFGPHSLSSLSWTQFELVDAGAEIAYRGECHRTPLQ